MIAIPTVKGPIAVDQLGVTLMHEHIFVLSTEIIENDPDLWGKEESRIADAIERLNSLKAQGVDSIVDLTVIGLGRYIPRIQRIAERTNINILVATGLYTYNEVPMHFHMRGPGRPFGGPERMTELFVRDIGKGIGDTGVKAAILKCATDKQGITKGVDRVLRAVAQAQRHTGVPISTHTHALSRSGLQQQRIFLEEGVDLSRVIIGHSGDTTDLDYLEELIANGSYLGMDRFGVDTILPFEQRVETVARMCAKGYAGRMVLSHDAACFNDWIPEGSMKTVFPRWNYQHIFNDVIPALKSHGVTDDDLKKMLVENPRNIWNSET